MQNLLIIFLSIVSMYLYIDNIELCNNENRLTNELSEVKNDAQYFEIYTNIFESKYCHVKIDSTINYQCDSITNYIIQSNK